MKCYLCPCADCQPQIFFLCVACFLLVLHVCWNMCKNRLMRMGGWMSSRLCFIPCAFSFDLTCGNNDWLIDNDTLWLINLCTTCISDQDLPCCLAQITDYLEANEVQRPVTIRTNTLKTRRRDLAQVSDTDSKSPKISPDRHTLRYQPWLKPETFLVGGCGLVS